jgi:hypothetical protein
MRSLVAALLVLMSASPCVAQVSTMGTTAMDLPTTQGAIVSSPLNGPSPFSSLAQSTAPVTTLAPVPTAQDPTTPGTVVTCASASNTTASTPSALSTIPSPLGNPLAASSLGSATGTVASTPLLGGSTLTSSCSTTSGSAFSNGSALPLFVPAVPSQPAVGTIDTSIAPPANAGVDPTAMSPTPNASACSESVTIDLTSQAMASANATGAAATPGVAPAGC